MVNFSSKNLNLGNIKDFLAGFFKNLSWLFFILFLVLLVLEGFEIKTSAGIVVNINKDPAVTTTQKGVRINFEAYNKVVQRIETAANFQPTGGINSNPFELTAPQSTPAQTTPSTPLPVATSTGGGLLRLP